MSHITKLELVARIGPGQLDIVQTYIKGLLSSTELTNLIGKSKALLVDKFITEYVVK